MSIMPNTVNIPPLPNDHKTTTLQAFSDYYLPSIEALIQYFHADSGFPVRDTWSKDIKAGNFASGPGLTNQNASKAYPTTNETLKGHMVQVHQGFCYTKPNPTRKNTNNLRLIVYLKIQRIHKSYISRHNT